MANEEEHETSIEPSTTSDWSTGRKRFAFSFFLFFSWLLWNVSVFHCTFVSLRIKNEIGDVAAVTELGLFHRADYGGPTLPLSYTTTNGEGDGATLDSYLLDDDDDDDYLSTRKRFTCVAYHPDTVKQFSSAEKASRAFGVIGYMSTTLALLLVFLVESVVSQTHRAQQMWLLTRTLLILSFISSLCIFSIFGSDFCQEESLFECALSSTGVASIVNIFVLMAVVGLSWIVQIPKDPIVRIRFWRKSDSGANNSPKQETADDNTPPQKIEKSTSAFRYAYLGLIVLTWLFWNISIFHCTFFALGSEARSYEDREEVYGLFRKALRENVNRGKIYSCSAFTYGERTEMDSAFTAARFFGAVGFLVHGCVLLLVSIMELVIHPPMRHRLWMGARILVMISFLCSLLIFTVFGTDLCKPDDSSLKEFYDLNSIKCVPFAAGIIAVWNILLMLGLVVVSWFTPVPDHPIFHVSMVVK